MNGFLLIDKQIGINSFKLVIILRKLLGMKRVGFAGTLDPLASGLMIIAVGEYTKLLPYLEAKDKVYEVDMLMGKVSDTYDIDGNVVDYKINNDTSLPTYESIEQQLNENFSGEIMQVPPRFSAIQIGGRRAYDMARGGEDFAIQARRVVVHSISVKNFDFPHLELRVHCGSGTYIRSLVHDLGDNLGVGGVVNKLRRTKIGLIDMGSDLLKNYVIKSDELEGDKIDKHFVPHNLIFPDFLKFELSEDQYKTLANGNYIDEPTDFPEEVSLALFQDTIVGVLERANEVGKLKFKKKLNIF